MGGYWTYVQWAGRSAGTRVQGGEGGYTMSSIFYIIGVVVVVLAILGYFGLR